MKLRITYTKSSIGYSKSQKATVRSLGLRKLHSVSIRDDNNSIRGMIFSVKHLVTVEEVADDTVLPTKPARKPMFSRTVPVADTVAFAPSAVAIDDGSPVVATELVTVANVAPVVIGDVAPVVIEDAAPIATLVQPAVGLSDDLEIVEGIGPKIASVLRSEGITSLAQLATTTVDVLGEILARNELAQIASPTTWSEQAQLAADGKLDELMQLQRTLRGGRAT